MLILETTFSVIDRPERDSPSIQPRQVTSKYFLIFNEPYEMFSLQSFLHLFKRAKKNGFCFAFTEMRAQFVIHKPVTDI